VTIGAYLDFTRAERLKICIDSQFLKSTVSEIYKSKFTLARAIKAYEEVEVTLHSF
jgi:hypothetical protein